MGVTLIALDRQLSENWPELAIRAGCSIEGITTEPASGHLHNPSVEQVIGLINGRHELTVAISGGGMFASLSIAKLQAQSEPKYIQHCVVHYGGRQNHFLELLLSRLMVASGGLLVDGFGFWFNNSVILRANTGKDREIILAMGSEFGSISTEWSCASSGKNSSQTAERFKFTESRRNSPSSIRLWRGPCLGPDRAMMSFLAIERSALSLQLGGRRKFRHMIAFAKSMGAIEMWP
jgi:hypothetical protein